MANAGGNNFAWGGRGVGGALTWMTRVVPFITASVSTLFAIACSSSPKLGVRIHVWSIKLLLQFNVFPQLKRYLRNYQKPLKNQ